MSNPRRKPFHARHTSYYSTLREEQKSIYKEKLHQAEVSEIASGTFDGTVLFTIFSTFLTKTTEAILHAWGRYVLFSGAVLANVLLTHYAWKRAQVDHKGSSRLAAIMQTLFTIPIAFAVGGSLILPATSLFATTIAPIIFAVTLGVKAVYQAMVASYLYNESFHGNELHRERHYKAALNNLIFAVSTLTAIPAILTVFLLGQAAFAPIGMVAGGLGAVWSAYIWMKKPELLMAVEHPHSDSEPEDDEELEHDGLEQGQGQRQRHDLVRERLQDLRNGAEDVGLGAEEKEEDEENAENAEELAARLLAEQREAEARRTSSYRPGPSSGSTGYVNSVTVSPSAFSSSSPLPPHQHPHQQLHSPTAQTGGRPLASPYSVTPAPTSSTPPLDNRNGKGTFPNSQPKPIPTNNGSGAAADGSTVRRRPGVING
jgi:hypothetical protein